MGQWNQIEPPAELEQQILNQISILRERRARTRLFAFGFLALGSFSAFLYVLASLGQSLAQSSFYQYLRLLWSDQSVLVYWQDLVWSLAESLPVLVVVTILAIAGLCLWSILKALENNHYGFKKFNTI